MVLESEKIYMAGLFDGEGCVHINKWRGRSKKGDAYSLLVQIKMCDGRLLTHLHQQFGGNLALDRRSLINPRHSDIQVWRVGCAKAKDFLESILPYLKLKKLQAKLAIQFQERMPQWKGNKVLSDEELSYREACYKRMRELKQLERTYRLL